MDALIHHLRNRITVLEDQRGATTTEVSFSFPTTWENLEDWATNHLSERAILTRKAIRLAKRSKYEDISFAYEVLKFLADTYVPAKLGSLEGGWDALRAEEARLSIQVGPVGEAPKTHKLKDTYSTKYKGQLVPLDMHISGNSNRDPRYGFRLYFHWEPEDQCVVVGAFPEHLENSLT